MNGLKYKIFFQTPITEFYIKLKNTIERWSVRQVYRQKNLVFIIMHIWTMIPSRYYRPSNELKLIYRNNSSSK